MLTKHLENHIKMNGFLKVNIIEQGIVYNDQSWKYKGVESPYHRIYYIASGSIVVENKEESYTLKAGDFYFIRKSTKMDYYGLSEFNMFYLHIQIPVVSDDLFNAIDKVVKFSMTEEDVLTYKAFFEDESMASYCNGMAIIYKQLPLIFKNSSLNELPKLPTDPKHVELISDINRELSIKMTVGDMAKQCGHSISVFTRNFKLDIGISPKAYLHKQVVEHAAKLLVITDLSVKEISNQLDFKDNLYFSRFFKKHYGISPKEYRSKNKPL